MRVRTRSLRGCRPVGRAALSVLPATAGADGFPLVGWWPMNEGSGPGRPRLVGARQQRHAGQLAPASTTSDPAWIRGVFAGSGAAASAANDMRPDPRLDEPRAGQQMTVAAWVCATRPRPARTATSSPRARTSACGRAYGLYTGRATAAWPSTSPTTRQDFYRSPEAPATGVGRQVAQRRGHVQRTTVRLYVDGKQIGNGTAGWRDRSTTGSLLAAASSATTTAPTATARRRVQPVHDRRRRWRADLVAGAACRHHLAGR